MAEAPTLDQWEHAGIIPIDLPPVGGSDAYTVQFKTPDLSAFIAAGLIPNPLLPLALRIEQEGVAEDTLSAEEITNYLDLQCLVIASNLRAPNLLESMTLPDATEWVRENVPPLHRRKIWTVAMHMDLPEAVKGLMELARFRDGATSRDVPGSGGADGEVAV